MKSYRVHTCWMGIYCVPGCASRYACLWVDLMCPVSVHTHAGALSSYKYDLGGVFVRILTLPGCLSDHEGIAPNSGDAPCTTRVHRGFRAFVGVRRHNLCKGETSVRATRHSTLLRPGLALHVVVCFSLYIIVCVRVSLYNATRNDVRFGSASTYNHVERQSGTEKWKRNVYFQRFVLKERVKKLVKKPLGVRCTKSYMR